MVEKHKPKRKEEEDYLEEEFEDGEYVAQEENECGDDKEEEYIRIDGGDDDLEE
jgi:hypothetical protein